MAAPVVEQIVERAGDLVAAMLGSERPLPPDSAGAGPGLDHEEWLSYPGVEQPETQGPFGGFRGQFAVVSHGQFQRCVGR